MHRSALQLAATSHIALSCIEHTICSQVDAATMRQLDTRYRMFNNTFSNIMAC